MTFVKELLPVLGVALGQIGQHGECVPPAQILYIDPAHSIFDISSSIAKVRCVEINRITMTAGAMAPMI